MSAIIGALGGLSRVSAGVGICRDSQISLETSISLWRLPLRVDITSVAYNFPMFVFNPRCLQLTLPSYPLIAITLLDSLVRAT